MGDKAAAGMGANDMEEEVEAVELVGMSLVEGILAEAILAEVNMATMSLIEVKLEGRWVEVTLAEGRQRQVE